MTEKPGCRPEYKFRISPRSTTDNHFLHTCTWSCLLSSWRKEKYLASQWPTHHDTFILSKWLSVVTEAFFQTQSLLSTCLLLNLIGYSVHVSFLFVTQNIWTELGNYITFDDHCLPSEQNGLVVQWLFVRHGLFPFASGNMTLKGDGMSYYKDSVQLETVISWDMHTHTQSERGNAPHCLSAQGITWHNFQVLFRGGSACCSWVIPFSSPVEATLGKRRSRGAWNSPHHLHI